MAIQSRERERERERKKKTHFKFQDLFPLLRFSWLYYFNLSIGDTNIVNNEITTEPLRSWANEFGRGWQWRRWQILTQNDESTCLSDAVKRPRRSGKTPRNDTDKALEKGSTIRHSWWVSNWIFLFVNDNVFFFRVTFMKRVESCVQSPDNELFSLPRSSLSFFLPFFLSFFLCFFLFISPCYFIYLLLSTLIAPSTFGRNEVTLFNTVP